MSLTRQGELAQTAAVLVPRDDDHVVWRFALIETNEFWDIEASDEQAARDGLVAVFDAEDSPQQRGVADELMKKLVDLNVISQKDADDIAVAVAAVDVGLAEAAEEVRP